MIRVRSMSTNLGSALCEVEFQDIDDTGPLLRVRGQYIASIEGRYLGSDDPDLIAALEHLLESNETQQ